MRFGLGRFARQKAPQRANLIDFGPDLGRDRSLFADDAGKIMREDRSKYNKDAGMQKEYRALIEAMQKNGLMDRNGDLKAA